MPDQGKERPKDDLRTRRDLLRRVARLSAIAALAVLYAGTQTGCGGGGEDEWYDYSDSSWNNTMWSNVYSDASYYGNAYA